MADDPRYRTQRSDPHLQDRTSRSASAAPKEDPLAELARLIGQDEAFIAASRHGAQAKDRDAQHGSERDSPAPSWLTRASQRLSQARSGSGAYEPETSPRDSGRGGDVETDIAPRVRQMPSRWDAAAEDDEVRYGAGHGAQDGAHQGWHASRGDPQPQEEFG